MRLPRRQFLQLAAGAAAGLPSASLTVPAQSYPSRPVRIVVGFPAGGGADILARLMGHLLSERLGQQFIVENRPGAGTNLATEAVVRAAPDGHTLLLATQTNTINASLYPSLNFDFIRDIAPVAAVARVPHVMVVNPSLPARTVPEFIAYAKANAGKLNMASGGIGSTGHVMGELFKMMAGIDMIHVPYRGAAPALTDLAAGRVHVIFDSLTSSMSHIKAGILRPIAVTTRMRSPTLPDVSAIAEFVPGYEASAWVGFAAPRDTPHDTIEMLNQQINALLGEPKIKERLAGMGVTPLGGSPAEFAELIAGETKRWAAVIKYAGLS